MNFLKVQLSTVQFGELELSNLTVLVLFLLSGFTFLSVIVSSLKLFNFNSRDIND